MKKNQLKAEIKTQMEAMSQEFPELGEMLTTSLNTIIDFFDERITKIEKATGFLG